MIRLTALIGMIGCFSYALAVNEKSGSTSESAINLATAAQASSSYISDDASLTALNDQKQPRASDDRSGGSYGNWNQKGTQWVQYKWSRPISTCKIEIYWWDDHRGVRLPRACRLLYWNDREFAAVGNPSGLGVEKDKYNTTTFDEISTTILRLEIDSDEDFSTGILEWKVYDSGKSPAFPPRVNAGIDRDVILGGKTYLLGNVQTLDGKSHTAKWTKTSGPGEVSFADAASPQTTTTFSKLGEYTLTLSTGTVPLAVSSSLKVKVTPAPPAVSLNPVNTMRYQINSPLWNSRAKALIVNWIPHCIKKINDPQLKEGGMNNFINAANKLAGKEHGPHRGKRFSDAWIYNTIESICVALMVDPQGDAQIIAAQKSMQATLDDWIPKILAAQEPDGYLQTAFTLNGRPHWSPEFRGDHEGYTAGYFLEAAVSHHLLTGGKDTRLYDAAKKLADCWYNNIGPAPKKEWFDGHQAMEMALVRFGRYVNEVEGKGDNYIQLAKFLLDCRKNGGEYDQSHLPVVQQYEVVGHAVRASYNYAGMADVAKETGDIDYHSAVISLWDNMVNKKYYVTGGIGSGETSEGFGPNYSLRHDAYCESCSSCGAIYFQHRLNMIYHDAKYADLYEETFYNALLGSIDLPGRNFYYQNPLNSRGPRYEWHSCPCCVGNIPRVLLMLPTWIYVKGEDSLYVNLFAGSTVNVGQIAGTDVQMIQDTKYPWDGNVKITVNPKTQKAFAIRIRVPNRSVSELYSSAPESDGITSISVNDKPFNPAIENGYAVINRTWKAGDRIELILPMKVQRIKGVEQIKATQGRVALRYGPLIYSAENVDQKLGGILPSDAALTTEWKGDLLEGVMIIKGKWNDGSDLTAIPYYARENRNSVKPQQQDSPGSSIWLKDN